MKTRTIIIFVLIVFSGIAQEDTKPNPLNELNQMDSAFCEVYNHVSKEMILPGEREQFSLIGRKKISPKDTQKTLSLFKKSKKLKSGIALLTHKNIHFIFFFGGKEIARIMISSYTRKVILIRFTSADDPDETAETKLISLNGKQQKFVTTLLKKYHLWELLGEDLQFPKD